MPRCTPVYATKLPTDAPRSPGVAGRLPDIAGRAPDVAGRRPGGSHPLSEKPWTVGEPVLAAVPPRDPLQSCPCNLRDIREVRVVGEKHKVVLQHQRRDPDVVGR